MRPGEKDHSSLELCRRKPWSGRGILDGMKRVHLTLEATHVGASAMESGDVVCGRGEMSVELSWRMVPL